MGPNATAIEGDRGQTASMRVHDENGTPIILGPGAVPRSAPTAPQISWADETTLNMTSYDHEQARDLTAAHQRKRKGQVLQVKNVTMRKTFPAKTAVRTAFNVETFARPAAKTVLVLLEHVGVEHDNTLDALWAFVRAEGGIDGPVRFWWTPFRLPGATPLWAGCLIR
jgi:hypothetical protein